MVTDQLYITDKQSVKDGINMEIFKCFDWVKPQTAIFILQTCETFVKGCSTVLIFIDLLASHNKEKHLF